MIRSKIAVWFLAAISLACHGLAAEPAKVSPRGNSLDLVFDLVQRPLRVELHIEINGQSLPAFWDDSFARMAAYYDRDGDGALDRREADRLPAPFAVRQLLWGQMATTGGEPPPFEELDVNVDGRVDSAELADWYRRNGLGGALVGVGRAPAADALTAAVIELLDANRDGAVDEPEWRAADTALAAVDGNDDGMIGPGELVSKTVYPGASGAALNKAPAANSQTSPLIDVLPFLVLPLRTDDRHWLSTAVTRRQLAKLPSLGEDEIASLRNGPPPIVWDIRFGERAETAAVLSVRGMPNSRKSRLELTADRQRLELRFDEGQLSEQLAAARSRFDALFAECDSDANEVLDSREIKALKARQFQQLLAAADIDDDGNLSKAELNRWLDLHERLARGQILLTVLDHGEGLFELLDGNHDGSLSVRELRQSWAELQNAGCIADGRFDRSRLPRHLLATISHGHPLSLIGRSACEAPAWFLAMDRNGDGDLSRGEFTGSAEVFNRLDTDRDGLVSPAEAAAYRK